MITEVQNQTQQVQEVPAKIPFSDFYGYGRYKFAVYPDYWKESWGRRPLLGYVMADDAFYAKREAYNQGLLTLNYTFRPKVVRVPYNNPHKQNRT